MKYSAIHQFLSSWMDGLQAEIHALQELRYKSGEELSVTMVSMLDRAFKGEL